MPAKNTVRFDIADSYHHVYSRGWNKGEIFNDEEDYAYFEHLLAQILAMRRLSDGKGRDRKWLRPQLDLNAYCLMPNHFHFLTYQRVEGGLTELMRSLNISYAMYFNKKYKRRGPLFESRFKAVLISSEPQLQHVTRYIHLNHWNFRKWSFSSYKDYLKPDDARDWLACKPILDLFGDASDYEQFVLDYEEEQRTRDRIKRELELQEY